MILFIILLVLLFIIGFQTFLQEGFNKEGWSSFGLTLAVIFGLTIFLMLCLYVNKEILSAINLFILIACGIIAIIADKSKKDKFAGFMADLFKGILFLFRGVLFLTALFSFYGNIKYLSEAYNFVNDKLGIIGLHFPGGIVSNIMIFVLLYALIFCRRGIKDKAVDIEKDVEKITRDYDACTVVHDIKEASDLGIEIASKEKKFTGTGYKKRAKKVWLLMYSILGLIFTVLQELHGKYFSHLDILNYSSTITLFSMIMYLITTGMENKYFYKYYKIVKSKAPKIEEYKESYIEVKNLLSYMWYEDAPLLITNGVELNKILNIGNNFYINVYLEISPGLSALTYNNAGSLLNKNFDEYLKQISYKSVKVEKWIRENPELNDLEIRIKYEENFSSKDEKKSGSKIFSVIEEKTNDAKAAKIIQLLDDYIKNELCANWIEYPYERISNMYERLKKLNNDYILVNQTAAFVKPYEFIICYCGKELLRYNLVDCQDGELVKTIEDIYKKMSSAEFNIMITENYIEKVEKTINDNIGLFSNYKDIIAKNKKLFNYYNDPIFKLEKNQK